MNKVSHDFKREKVEIITERLLKDTKFQMWCLKKLHPTIRRKL